MAERYCCKQIDGSYKDCREDEYDLLPNNERKVNIDGSPCGGGTNPNPTNTYKENLAKICGHASWEDYKGSTPKWSCPTMDTDDKKLKKAKECGYSTFDEFKKAEFKCNTQSPGTSGYRVCTGTYKVNCKDPNTRKGNPDPNGTIYKVQKCLGFTLGNGLDGFFGPRTEGALQAKMGYKSFTDDQVETICKGVTTDGNTGPGIYMPLTKEDKVKYFEDLVDQKRIYINGILDDSNFDDVVYVVKYVDGKQTPLNSLNEIKKDGLKNEEYRILLFYAPVSLKEKGLYKDLVVVTEDWGEDVYDIIGNTRQTWEPNKAKPKIGLGENHLKSILKKVIKEQVLGGTNVPRPKQNTVTTTTTTQQITTTTTTQPGQTKEEPKELDATQCRDLVIQYLYGAFTASDVEAVGSAMAKGKILDTDAKTIKNRLCGCYKLGDLNDIEISKNDFTSGKYRLNPDFLNFRFLNKKLKWPEIKKLVQTGKNKGFEIGRGYIDSSFGERKMCIGQVNESVKQTIKSHITEAINKKKTLTESIVNKVTKKLI